MSRSTNNNPDYPANLSLDDLLVRVANTHHNPNIGKVYSAKLREGKQTSRIAVLREILNSKTGEFHHYSLTISSYKLLKAGWYAEKERSITIESGKDDEINKLIHFLNSILQDAFPSDSGEYHILNAKASSGIKTLIELAEETDNKGKLELLQVLLQSAAVKSANMEKLVSVLQSSSTEVIQNIATASKLIEYRRAYEYFEKLVAEFCDKEQLLQNHLKENPWLFGSEYSVLLDRRKWTRDDNLDFMLRRTTDGYLEIIEIKTPFNKEIMLHDGSHNSYYPSNKLSMTIGQVQRYISEIEKNRSAIIAQDNEDPFKIRARLIIGRDGDKKHQEALRDFNSHQNRLEILTFDQLLRIGKRTLDVFESEQIEENDSHQLSDNKYDFFDDGIPF